ncbi:DUF6346 domain-containing protein [Lentzea sp. NPDC051213]|uniref:DUF6346 domain-containing protein n=1 Tax=Lentzea sp. NPDC051213 TaxID=3364126 RepID=UPI00378E220B
MKRAVAILLMLGPIVIGAPLGWFLTATIAYHFLDQYGPDPAVRDDYVVAKSCERVGPVTSHGFGYWWECRVDSPRGERTADFLTPADIGKPVAAVWDPRSSSKGRGSHYDRAAEQPHEAGVWWAVAFVPAWIGLIVLMIKLGGRVIDRIDPDPSAQVDRSKRVRIGTPPWLDWLHPVTFSPEGMTWVGRLIRWREIREVRLVGDTLHVRPLDGDWIPVGPFSGRRLLVVHQALELFVRTRYRDQRAGNHQPPESFGTFAAASIIPAVSAAPVVPVFPAGPAVRIRGGAHPTYLLWPNRFMLAATGVAVAVQSPEPVITIIAAAVAVLVIADGLRRRAVCPLLTVGPDGVCWKDHEFDWREIAEVRLVRNTLYVQPRVGEVAQVGPFAPNQATRIHAGLFEFGGDRYRVASLK